MLFQVPHFFNLKLDNSLSYPHATSTFPWECSCLEITIEPIHLSHWRHLKVDHNFIKISFRIRSTYCVFNFTIRHKTEICLFFIAWITWSTRSILILCYVSLLLLTMSFWLLFSSLLFLWENEAFQFYVTWFANPKQVKLEEVELFFLSFFLCWKDLTLGFMFFTNFLNFLTINVRFFLSKPFVLSSSLSQKKYLVVLVKLSR